VSWAYRCMKCRGRNTLPRQVEDYRRAPKCRHCGHKSFYLDKARQYRRDYCSCEGYHHTHRAKSPFCIENPNYELNVRVRRYGEDLLDVQIDIAFDAPMVTKSSEKPPF
jgi:DNA-directed RNA polymerase subunit RPC12/RpoP